MNFICCRCSRAGRYSTWVLARWLSENTVHRCEFCGTPHSVRSDRSPDPIGPELFPVTVEGRNSPWYDAKYRPYNHGVYTCEFADGLRLRLRWDGKVWLWCSQPVDTSTLRKWRGTWAAS